MRIPYTIITLVLIAGLSACTPESLEGLDVPDNNANNENNVNNENNTNNQNNSNNQNNTNNLGEFTAEFTAVTEIMTDTCTQASCHGSNSTTVFSVATDDDANESEMQAAFEGDDGEGIIADVSGLPLIDPNNAEGSDIYDRMNREASDSLVMPQGTGPLDETRVNMVRDWINNGAIYRE